MLRVSYFSFLFNSLSHSLHLEFVCRCACKSWKQLDSGKKWLLTGRLLYRWHGKKGDETHIDGIVFNLSLHFILFWNPFSGFLSGGVCVYHLCQFRFISAQNISVSWDFQKSAIFLLRPLTIRECQSMHKVENVYGVFVFYLTWFVCVFFGWYCSCFWFVLLYYLGYHFRIYHPFIYGIVKDFDVWCD